MATSSGRDYQPLVFKMAGPSQAKTGSNPPGVTLEQLAKTLEEMRAQFNALTEEQNQQTRELRARLAEVERSVQDDNERRHRRHERDDHDQDTDVDSDNGNDRRGRGRGPDPDGWVMKSVKIDAPTFDGRMDPQVFSDWLSDMDHYFKWYEMSEARKVKLATMKLVSQARIFWTNLEHHEQRLGLPAIDSWERMKERLKDKYLPQSYRERLLDQRSNLRQGSMTVSEYITKFEEFNLRCDVREDLSSLLSWFRTGLRPEIRKELIQHRVTTLAEMYEKVQDLEQYVRFQFPKKVDSRNMEPRVNPMNARSNSGNLQQKGTTNNHSTSWDPKGKGVAFENSQRTSQTKCYKCQGYGHFAATCPTRNLFIEEVQDDSDLDVDNYVPDFVPSDDDCGDSEDRVSFLRFLPTYQTRRRE
eukprot:TRINITY_DN23914_c0_g4_i3.p1 TRINITY_DN23914_c0_g4~~TRINITY_DN23914_c0_g4_i3.p1  ORF type:complete len:415 (+),score=60.05 TRINITY_DN23914_c0_g4_i3:201-1445(+)